MHRLKELREAAGMKQVELARRAGLTPGAVCHIEKGDRPHPRYSTVVALAAALGVEPSQLFDDPERANRPAA